MADDVVGVLNGLWSSLRWRCEGKGRVEVWGGESGGVGRGSLVV